MDRRFRIETDNAPSSLGYRSNGMTAAGYVFTGGHIGSPLGQPGEHLPLAPTLEEQTDWCLRHAEQLSLAGGAPKDRVVEVEAFLVPFERQDVVRKHIVDFLGYEPPLVHIRPVRSMAMSALLELDWIALADPNITIEEATEVLRPWGHKPGLVRSGPFVMINGLSAPGETLTEQTYNLFAEADRQFQAAGSALSNVIKLSVFMGGGQYPDFNEATKKIFANFEPPTRSVLSAPDITGDSLLKIDLIALAGEP